LQESCQLGGPGWGDDHSQLDKIIAAKRQQE
jgi:hypothetical protein